MASKKNQPKRPQQQQQSQSQDQQQQQPQGNGGALGGGVSLGGGLNGPARRGSWRAGGSNVPSPSATPLPQPSSSSSISTPAATTPKPEPSSQPVTKPKSDDAATNLSSKSASLLGSKVLLTLRSSKKFQGTLAAADTSLNKDGSFGLSLRMVKEVGSPHDARTREMSFRGTDVLDVVAAKEEGIPGISAGRKDTFRTDTDISSSTSSSNPPIRERVLEPWQPSPSDPSSSSTHNLNPSSSSSAALDESTFGSSSLSSLPSNGSGGGKAWDQFAENEKRFGTTTSFHEELYTTKLDRSGPGFRERERKAEVLAGQIMGMSSGGNVHLQEERGQKGEGEEELGEEEKYSGVIRNPNAYVPPGARNNSSLSANTSGPPPSTASFPPLSSAPKPSLSPSPSLSSTVGKPKPSLPSPSLAAAGAPTLPVHVSISNLGPGMMARSNSSIGPHANGPSAKSELPAVAKETHQDGRPAPTVRLPSGGGVATPGSEDGPASTTTLAPSAGGEKNVLSAFHEFVKNDRQRLEAKKIQVAQKAKNEKEKRLKELVKFGQDFKLKSTIPADLVPILAKDAEKQKAIIDKAAADALLAASRPVPSPSSLKATLPINTNPLAASSGAGAGPAAAVPSVPFANRRQLIAGGPGGTGDGGKGKTMMIQDIPPFRPAALGGGASAGGEKGNAAAAAAARLSVNAPAFVFKPNPAAAAFKPTKSPVREIPPHRSGLQPTASPKVPATLPHNLNPQPLLPTSTALPIPLSQPSQQQQPLASTSQLPPSQPTNPFFGIKPPFKKGGMSVNVRDDFNPFKLAKLGEASSYPPTWSFNGKPYRALFPPLAGSSPSIQSGSPGYPYQHHQPPPHLSNGHPQGGGGGSPYPPHHPMAQHQQQHQQQQQQHPGMLDGGSAHGGEGWGVDGSYGGGGSQGPGSHLASPQPGHAQPAGAGGQQPGGGYPGGMYGQQYYGAGGAGAGGRGGAGYGYGGPPPMPGGPTGAGANGGYLHPVQSGGAYGGPHMFVGQNGVPPVMGGYPGYHPQYQGQQVFPGAAGGRAPMGYHQVQPGQMQSPQMGHGYPNQYQMHQQQQQQQQHPSQQHPPQTPQQGGGPQPFASPQPPATSASTAGGDA